LASKQIIYNLLSTLTQIHLTRTILYIYHDRPYSCPSKLTVSDNAHIQFRDKITSIVESTSLRTVWF